MSRHPIRPAEPRDAPAIAAIHAAAWAATYHWPLPPHIAARNTIERRTSLWQHAIAAARHDIFVATIDNEIAGFISACPMPPTIRNRPAIPHYETYVDALFVHPAHHRKGLGQALITHLAQTLHERGITTLALHVVTGNPAIGFYESLGAIHLHTEPLDPTQDEAQQQAYGWPTITPLLE